MIDRSVDVHSAKYILESVGMLILPALLRAWEWDFGASTMNFTGQRQPQSKSLGAVHEVGAGCEANDDIGTNFRVSPGTSCAHLFENIMLRIIEDIVVILHWQLTL